MYKLDTLMSVMQSLCVEPQLHRRFNNELKLSFIDLLEVNEISDHMVL